MISTGTRIDRGVAESAKNALVVIEHAQGQPVPGAVTETAFGSEAGDRRDIPISLAIHVALVGHRTRYEEAFPQVILPFQLHSVKRRFPQGSPIPREPAEYPRRYCPFAGCGSR